MESNPIRKNDIYKWKTTKKSRLWLGKKSLFDITLYFELRFLDSIITHRQTHSLEHNKTNKQTNQIKQ